MVYVMHDITHSRHRWWYIYNKDSRNNVYGQDIFAYYHLQGTKKSSTMKSFTYPKLIGVALCILAVEKIYAARNANAVVFKIRLCVRYEIQDYQSIDEPLQIINDTATRSLCMGARYPLLLLRFRHSMMVPLSTSSESLTLGRQDMIGQDTMILSLRQTLLYTLMLKLPPTV